MIITKRFSGTVTSNRAVLAPGGSHGGKVVFGTAGPGGTNSSVEIIGEPDYFEIAPGPDIIQTLQLRETARGVFQQKIIEIIQVPLTNFKKLLQDTLAYGDCADFMSKLISKAGELSKGKNDPISTDIMTLYKLINQQSRGGFRLNHEGSHDLYTSKGYEKLPDFAGGGGAMSGTWAASNRTIWINEMEIPVQTSALNRARVPFEYAERALHEFFHAAGKSDYYSHDIMNASAAAFEPGLNVDQAIKKHCLPSEMW